MKKFYDTSSLLLLENFDEPFIISSITLCELEDIKTSNRKDEEVRATARKILHLLDINEELYTIKTYNSSMLKPIVKKNLEINNDVKILATALECAKTEDLIFVTNDLSLKMLAKLFFTNDKITSIITTEDKYVGYKHFYFSDEGLNMLYSNLSDNEPYGLNINEYLIVHNEDGDVVDKMCWTGETLRPVKYYTFQSRHIGDLKPKPGDIYQALAMDSLMNNQITLLKGPAGSGKSILSLAFLFHLLEKHKIDKIIIFCNTVATKGAAKLGYLPGSRDEKLLDSQIGNMLSSKLGDKMVVEKLIAEGKLLLLPMSDVRGFDTSGMNAGIYITEAQNMDISLMKLALQRIGEDSICIIDGDPLTQVDDLSFAGVNNGMRRVSKVFRNTDVYGEVELKNIHRSKIANIAQNL